jgi:hypothetical protein
MAIRIDPLGACRNIVRSTTALAFTAAAALAASATSADAGASMITAAWSSGFDDSLWTNNGLGRARALSPIAGWATQCFVNCGPAFGTYAVHRIELLSSNTADISVNKAADLTGHAMAVGGMVVTERLEADSFSADPTSLLNWVVVGERTLDGNGTHSWELLSPDISPDAHWLPIDLYRFEGSSFSMDLAAQAPAGASATPEASTWAMTLIGFAGLGFARYRSARNCRPSIHFAKGMYPR